MELQKQDFKWDRRLFQKSKQDGGLAYASGNK